MRRGGWVVVLVGFLVGVLYVFLLGHPFVGSFWWISLAVYLGSFLFLEGQLFMRPFSFTVVFYGLRGFILCHPRGGHTLGGSMVSHLFDYLVDASTGRVSFCVLGICFSCGGVYLPYFISILVACISFGCLVGVGIRCV